MFSLLAIGMLHLCCVQAFLVPISKTALTVLNQNNRILQTTFSTEHDVFKYLPNTKATFPPELTKDNVFRWKANWYAIGVENYTDKARPHRVKVLDENYVLWYDGVTEHWSVLSDACPHRLAPLSEGRIEVDGTLACAYHAWGFNDAGNCVTLPQSKEEQKNSHQSRVCATSFPVIVKQGIIFMWPQSGLEALVHSSTKNPSLVSELDDDGLMASGRVVVLPLNFRHLPYGWETFFENVLDPAHVPCSHHNTMGNRYTGPAPLETKLKTAIDTYTGFTAGYATSATQAKGLVCENNWTPPGHLINRLTHKDGTQFIISSYATPTMPGRCLFTGTQILIKPEKSSPIPASLFQFKLPLPVWIQHVMFSIVLHQDSILLHQQELNLAREGINCNNFNRRISSMNGQDNIVRWFKTWLSSKGCGGIDWPEKTDTKLTELSRDDVFDVWQTHTSSCTVCSKAWSNMHKVAHASKILGFVSLWAAITVGCKHAFIFATLAYILHTGVNHISQLFVSYSYNHQDNK